MTYKEQLREICLDEGFAEVFEALGEICDEESKGMRDYPELQRFFQTLSANLSDAAEDLGGMPG
jgi:hypothetical protein